MGVVRVGDKACIYDKDGHLIFYGDCRTLIRWVKQTERYKLGSDKKIHGLE
jgi:hypothetical protein